MTPVESYFKKREELNEKGYRFEADKFESVKKNNVVQYPCYFMGGNDYDNCFVLVAVFEDGRLTVIRQNQIVKGMIEVEIRSSHDQFLADKAVKNKRYAFDNIYVDLMPIKESKFETFRNTALYNLTEVNLNDNKNGSL